MRSEKEVRITPGTATAREPAIRPFRVNIPEEELADLRRRVLTARLPERETVSDFSQGVRRVGTSPRGSSRIALRGNARGLQINSQLTGENFVNVSSADGNTSRLVASAARIRYFSILIWFNRTGSMP